MIRPVLAPVRPHAIAPETGDLLPLEELVRPLVARDCGAIEIVGGPGAGKTTALAHVAATLGLGRKVLLLDDPDGGRVAAEASRRVVLYTSDVRHDHLTGDSFRLASWGEDELIEYLLAVHPARCRSVMRRVRNDPTRRRLHGRPELWRIVLDRMAEDEALDDTREALRREWRARCPAEEDVIRVTNCCLAILASSDPASTNTPGLKPSPPDAPITPLLRHRVIRVMVAAEGLAKELKPGRSRFWLTQRLPRDVIQETSALVATDRTVLDRLKRLLAGESIDTHATAASLLHATGIGWIPQRSPAPCLRGAYLEGATWPGVDLSGVNLRGTDLTEADLTEAVLDRADLHAACLRHAVLRGAVLRSVEARGADLGHADLAGANAAAAEFCRVDLTEANLEGASLGQADFAGARLSGARFVGADLSAATFLRAEIGTADFSAANLRNALLAGTDLREATLTGACLTLANLTGCNLEHVDVPKIDLLDALLHSALLTGSRLPGACLRGANLQCAALADIDWEGADLREANLQKCTFHMGSSRSGLVDTPIASEGSRTGFYTDEFDQQHFRPPEEIRKANLCGVDLRGADIAKTDFYMVDLRGAQYTPEQANHFRRCGAILADPMA